MRVLPLENEDVNECWLSDKDRFSYEALDSAERLTTPMIKQGGEWQEVDWQTALEYVAHGLKQHQARARRRRDRRLSPPRTRPWKNWTCCKKLMRGLGSENVDFRLRQTRLRAGRPKSRRGWACRSPNCRTLQARVRDRLLPAQGPPAVRDAPARGRQARRQAVASCTRPTTTSLIADRQQDDRRAVRLAGRAVRTWLPPWPQPRALPRRPASKASSLRRRQGDRCQPADRRRTQGASCWVTPPRSIRKHRSCTLPRSGSPSRPAPSSAT